jgi:hypothetical protein
LGSPAPAAPPFPVLPVLAVDSVDCRPASAGSGVRGESCGESRSLVRLPIAPCAASRGPADRHSLPELGAAPASHDPSPLAGRAAFSACGQYRWWLARIWVPRAPRLLFLGLNPSRADGRRDDPTLRRLVRSAQDWGYGGVEVLNLFARVSPSPAALRRCEDPVGGRCDAWIRRRLGGLTHHGAPVTLWLGWGNGGSWRGRDAAVLGLLAGAGWSALCLGRTRSGHPRHPLYRPRGEPLLRFAPSCGVIPPPPLAPLPWPVFPVATPFT